MKHRDNRIEPIFEEDAESGWHQAGPPPFDLEPEAASIHPAIKIAAIAVVLACLFFVGERLYIHYQARQAVKVLERELETLGTHMTQSLKQAGAATERMNQQAKARAAAAQKQQRRTRMATTEGGWLAKNCADWTRAWNQMKAPTAEREMNKHCGRLERYLETGIAPPGTPRAENRTR